MGRVVRRGLQFGVLVLQLSVLLAHHRSDVGTLFFLFPSSAGLKIVQQGLHVPITEHEKVYFLTGVATWFKGIT